MDERFIPYSVQGAEMVQVLVREWRPDTWELSPLKLIEFPKKEKSHEFGKYLQGLFPHIHPDNLFASRTAVYKIFHRSDLIFKKWLKVASSGVGNAWLGTSQYELTRDGILIVVKDKSIPLREDLTQEEKDNFCSKSYLEHQSKKGLTVGATHRNHDALLSATQERTVNWNQSRGGEKGVKI